MLKRIKLTYICSNQMIKKWSSAKTRGPKWAYIAHLSSMGPSYWMYDLESKSGNTMISWGTFESCMKLLHWGRYEIHVRQENFIKIYGDLDIEGVTWVRVIAPSHHQENVCQVWSCSTEPYRNTDQTKKISSKPTLTLTLKDHDCVMKHHDHEQHLWQTLSC